MSVNNSWDGLKEMICSRASTMELNVDFIDKVGTIYSSLLSNDYKKQMGVVYTPSWLAAHIAQNAINQWTKFNSHISEPTDCADLSCGAGVFLRELLHFASKNEWTTTIVGKDIDEKIMELNKLSFYNNNTKLDLKVEDALLKASDIFNTEKQYDIIVGNPPYVNSASLDKQYKNTLSLLYETAQQGSFDLSIIFLEKIVRSLKQGGVASIILSNKFMTSAYGKTIVSILSKDCNILKIEDFNDIQVFDGFTTYTCIITFVKDKPGKRFVLRRYVEDIDFTKKKLPKYIEETLSQDRLKSHPWNFAFGKEDKIMRMCNNSKNPKIDAVFNGIQQGIRTGLNDVFVLDKNNAKQVEKGILKPFISGEDIKSISVNHMGNFVIFPYLNDNKSISPLKEIEFKNSFPKAYSYLLKHKDALMKRSLQNNSVWYEFGRRQSLDIAIKKKILIKEMMPNAKFAIDLKGEYIFASGYAIDVSNLPDPLVKSWALALSTNIMEFVMRHTGTQLHSGWFRMLKHHFDEFRLPPLTPEDLKAIENISNKKSEETASIEINSIVGKSFGLSETQLEFVDNYISEIHKKSIPQGKQKVSNDKFEPVKLEEYYKYHSLREDLRKDVTFAPNKNTPIHNWYKYTQGFSANLVDNLLNEFGADNKTVVLDPFNGCGTTTTVCSYRNIPSIGIEISPLMCLVAKIKGRKWDKIKLQNAIEKINLISKDTLIQKVRSSKWVFAEYLHKAYSSDILNQLDGISNYIAAERDVEVREFFTIGLLSMLEDVSKVRKHGSHYRFLDNTNSIGLQKLNIEIINSNADVTSIFRARLKNFYGDLCKIEAQPDGNFKIINESILESILDSELDSNSVDFVITSPPYLNRNNYIAQQKAELDILGLVKTKSDYNNLVKRSLKSHTDANLDQNEKINLPEVETIIANMEFEDGNNPKIPAMIAGYFNDLSNTLKQMSRIIKPGGKAAFIVGNTRWGGVVVPIDHLLAKMAEKEGFKINTILITRYKGNSPQQMKKFGKISVRESIVIFSKSES